MSNFSGKKSKSFGNLKVKPSNTKPINSQSKAEHKVGIDLEHEYWMTATCLQNLEDELESELLTLGAKQIKKKNRAVEFKGDKRLMYRSNLWLRTALRVLVPLSSFSIKNEDDLLCDKGANPKLGLEALKIAGAPTLKTMPYACNPTITKEAQMEAIDYIQEFSKEARKKSNKSLP